MRWAWALTAVMTGALGFAAGRLSIMDDQKIHVLDGPLLLEPDGDDRPHYLLPAGTTLYYDTSMPEGFDRFFVYVNVEGANLPLESPPKPGWKAPLTARPPHRRDLPRLMKSYPLEKDDLRQILDAVGLSKAELRALVEEYEAP